jgi:hypothetical protein
MKASLIIHHLSEIDHYQKVLFNRAIYGYTDNSNNNAYQYKRKGLLSQIPYLRLLNGALVIKKGDANKLKPIFKKYGVKYEIYDILIKESKLKGG